MTDQHDQTSFPAGTSPFDAIRHFDGVREWWLARELASTLRYKNWQNFEQVLAKAKLACKYNGRNVGDEFIETSKLIQHGKGGKRAIRDVELSRYACYMIVLSGDSAKPIVAHAKSYFAVQTRRQELADAEDFAQLSEDEKRLIYRTQLSIYHRKLAQTGIQKNLTFLGNAATL